MVLISIDKHKHICFSLKWNFSKCKLDCKRSDVVPYAPVGLNQVKEKEIGNHCQELREARDFTLPPTVL